MRKASVYHLPTCIHTVSAGFHGALSSGGSSYVSYSKVQWLQKCNDASYKDKKVNADWMIMLIEIALLELLLPGTDEVLSIHIMIQWAKLFRKYLNINPKPLLALEVLLTSWRLICLEEKITVPTQESVQYYTNLFFQALLMQLKSNHALVLSNLCLSIVHKMDSITSTSSATSVTITPKAIAKDFGAGFLSSGLYSATHGLQCSWGGASILSATWWKCAREEEDGIPAQVESMPLTWAITQSNPHAHTVTNIIMTKRASLESQKKVWASGCVNR